MNAALGFSAAFEATGIMLWTCSLSRHPALAKSASLTYIRRIVRALNPNR
jgi:hypothetical protein